MPSGCCGWVAPGALRLRRGGDRKGAAALEGHAHMLAGGLNSRRPTRAADERHPAVVEDSSWLAGAAPVVRGVAPFVALELTAKTT